MSKVVLISLYACCVVVLLTGGCQGNERVPKKQADDCGGNKFAPACIAPQLVAHYEEIIDLPNHPEKLLIDVREPTELAATGQIPTSINIPLKTVRSELALSADVFEEKYGRKKPTADDPIIFSCRSGVRAGQAALEADLLGFRNVKNYVGSWQEYGPKHGLPVK
uniref:Rhodanese domain-containing protein n=1 Tax=Anopheles atroparvus TaxID=41427 RepID=A0AAG5D8R0_ANOAO